MNFKILVVPKDEDYVFMSNPVEDVSALLPTIYSNKDLGVIKLSMNLPELSEMACSLTVVSNIHNIKQEMCGWYKPHWYSFSIS